MTAVDFDPKLAPQARAYAYKLQWGPALKALNRLLADKEDTRQVFEIMRALTGTPPPRATIAC